jgi:hypothetical protein
VIFAVCAPIHVRNHLKSSTDYANPAVTTATTTRKCEKKEEFLKRASNTARDIYQTHLQAGFRHGGVHANGGGATESERHVYFILRSKVVVCVIVMATAWQLYLLFFSSSQKSSNSFVA